MNFGFAALLVLVGFLVLAGGASLIQRLIEGRMGQHYSRSQARLAAANKDFNQLFCVLDRSVLKSTRLTYQYESSDQAQYEFRIVTPSLTFSLDLVFEDRAGEASSADDDDLISRFDICLQSPCCAGPLTLDNSKPGPPYAFSCYDCRRFVAMITNEVGRASSMSTIASLEPRLLEWIEGLDTDVSPLSHHIEASKLADELSGLTRLMISHFLFTLREDEALDPRP